MFYSFYKYNYHSIYFGLMCLQVGWGALAEESGHAPMGPPTTLLEQPCAACPSCRCRRTGSKPSLASTFQPSASTILANFPLVKASHRAKGKKARSTFCLKQGHGKGIKRLFY